MTGRDAGEHPALPAMCALVCGNGDIREVPPFTYAKGGYIAEVERLQAECRRLETECDELRADRDAALAATAAVRETWTRVARHNRTRAQEAEADRDREQQVAAAVVLHRSGWSEEIQSHYCTGCSVPADGYYVARWCHTLRALGVAEGGGDQQERTP